MISIYSFWDCVMENDINTWTYVTRRAASEINFKWDAIRSVEKLTNIGFALCIFVFAWWFFCSLLYGDFPSATVAASYSAETSLMMEVHNCYVSILRKVNIRLTMRKYGKWEKSFSCVCHTRESLFCFYSRYLCQHVIFIELIFDDISRSLNVRERMYWRWQWV